MEKPDFTKIKALLKEGTKKGPWHTNSDGFVFNNEKEDYYVLHAELPDAALIVELRNSIEGIMEWCEGLREENYLLKTELEKQSEGVKCPHPLCMFCYPERKGIELESSEPTL